MASSWTFESGNESERACREGVRSVNRARHGFETRCGEEPEVGQQGLGFAKSLENCPDELFGLGDGILAGFFGQASHTPGVRLEATPLRRRNLLQETLHICSSISSNIAMGEDSQSSGKYISGTEAGCATRRASHPTPATGRPEQAPRTPCTRALIVPKHAVLPWPHSCCCSEVSRDLICGLRRNCSRFVVRGG